jgi:hypothetical protein
MKKNILLLTIPLIVLLYLVLSVYYPNYFINGGNVNGINFELENFSIINPKYIGYQYDEAYSRYNVYSLELKRNWFMGWNVDYSKTQDKIVLKADIDQFKKELKQNSKSTDTKIADSPLIFIDKYQVLDTDTFEQRDYKRAWHPPIRSNSKNYSVDKFKLLKQNMKCEEYYDIIGGSDFGFTPDEFYPEYYRDVYNIGSKKVSFLFLTFKETYPCTTIENAKYVGLVDIVLITQRQEMIKVPVNPDGTYNWEAVKDMID